jgi:hypothetical protein
VRGSELKSENKTGRSPEQAAGQVKVLLYDVETSPHIGYTWNKWETDVIEFVKEKQIISFAWKWLGEREVHCLSMPMFKSYKKNKDDNSALIAELHKLFCEADVTIGHNVCAFDDKISNSEFVLHGLPPPPPHKQIDTLKVARKYFKFSSNKLGDLGQRLGVGGKVDTGGFSLWLGCIAGNPKSWALMEKYNKFDVVLLEKIYLKIRPWLATHPDMNGKDDHVGCPTCRSVDMKPRGWATSKGGIKKRRYQCAECGSWSTISGKNGGWKYR